MFALRRLVARGLTADAARKRVTAHSAATLAPRDAILVDTIPCTALARRLLDIAEHGTRRDVERALDRADAQRSLDLMAIDDVLSRSRRPSRRRAAARARVEVDGRDVHTTRRAFESDRRRDQRLATLGWRVVRFTWRQVTYDPAHVAGTLRSLLG